MKARLALALFLLVTLIGGLIGSIKYGRTNFVAWYLIILVFNVFLYLFLLYGSGREKEKVKRGEICGDLVY